MSEAIISGKSGSTTYAKMNLSYAYHSGSTRYFDTTSGSYAGSTISIFVAPTPSGTSGGSYVASDIVYTSIYSVLYLYAGSSTSSDHIELPDPSPTLGFYYYAGETVSSSFTVTSDDRVSASGTITATLDRSTGITFTYTMSSTTFYYVGDRYNSLYVSPGTGKNFGLIYI